MRPPTPPGSHLPNRRALLGAAGLAAFAPAIRQAGPARGDLVRPARLRPGDRVGMVSPASAAWNRDDVDAMRESLEALGLEVVLGQNFFARRGYFAGTDEQRTADIMEFFADDSIRGIWARGGWGSARVLPRLDYDVIAKNPKVLVGYSDATALLTGIHVETGLVTFHGPFPKSRFSADVQRALLMDGDAVTFVTPQEAGDSSAVTTSGRVRTLSPGKATGRLIGGNLSVFSAIAGSRFFPDTRGAILFLEDLNEAVYRVDRMLTTLSLAGALEGLAGFAFGHCTDCPPSSGHGSLTLLEVLHDHFDPLGIPACSGVQIGHFPAQFTLPLGVEAELDADAGSLALSAPAVR